MTAALALVAALLAQSRGDEPPGSPTAEEIAKAVARLGADDYHAREQATTWLWSVGPAAEPALRAALKSDDAEVVARARDLLDKIPYGITPDMPRRFVELIAAARSGGAAAWPGAVQGLLDLGPRGLEVAHKLLDRLAATPADRAALARTLDREGWRVAPHLLAAGQAGRAEELIERSAVAAAHAPAAPGTSGTPAARGDPPAVRHYAAFLRAQNRLADQAPRWRAWAERNEGKDGTDGRLADGSPDGKTAAAVLVALARLQGDVALARWAADRAGRPELKEAVLFDAGDWAELAARPPARTGNEPMIAVGLRELFLRAAGRDADADKALAELKGMRSPTYATAPPLLFRALMFARRPDDALASLADLKGVDGVVPRFEVLAQQHRYAEAFKALERTVPDRSVYRWRRDAALARTYHQLGEAAKLREVLRGVQQYDRLSLAEATAAVELIEQLVGLDLTDEALPVAAAVLNSGTGPREVFGKLFPKAPLAAETWWRFLRVQQPVAPMRETVARLPALLDRRLDGDEGKALIEAAAAAARAQPAADADRWLQGLGEACQAAGLAAAAQRFYAEATKRGDGPSAWQKLGEFLADQGRYADAARAFEAAWRKDVKQPLPLWLAGWAKTKAGAADGPALMDLAHTLPLGEEEARGAFADELAKRVELAPEAAEAARRERRLIVQLGLPASARVRNAQGLLSGDPRAFPDRLAAADATQRFLIRMLLTNAYFRRTEGYLAVLHRSYADRARGLLARGDPAGALAAAETAQATLPGHIGLAVVLVPELARLGRTADADAVYARAAAVLDGLVRDYPHSAAFANQRAYLAARCRRDLDRALALARKAVGLAPKAAGYLDTLAEVHFQRGERDQALERIKQALALDPKSELFLKQQARFQAGDRSAPVPEVAK